MRAMASPGRIHGNIESSFHGDRERRLWRIDHLRGEYYLLLLSEEYPDLTSLQKQFGEPDLPGETLDYSSLMKRLKPDSVWHFRLVANPTRSVKNEDGSSRGKICAEVSEKYMLQWLDRKASMNGFTVLPGESPLRESRWYSFRKPNSKRNIRFKAATFEGLLRIDDPILFSKALLSGIGREKAYGMGMLTIAGV